MSCASVRGRRDGHEAEEPYVYDLRRDHFLIMIIFSPGAPTCFSVIMCVPPWLVEAYLLSHPLPTFSIPLHPWPSKLLEHEQLPPVTSCDEL